MIKLCGFALSNYYNKVKFVLLEHEIPFEESFVMTSQDESLLMHSPLGKVPLSRPSRAICASRRPSSSICTRAFPRKEFSPRTRGKRRKSAS